MNGISYSSYRNVGPVQIYNVFHFFFILNRAFVMKKDSVFVESVDVIEATVV